MMSHRLTLIALALACATSLSSAQDNVATSMGRLHPLLESNKSDPIWRYSSSGATYFLENTKSPDAIKYVHVEPTQKPVSASVEVLIASRASAVSAAGLLYAFQRDGQGIRYFAFVTNGSEKALYQRDRDGLRKRASTSSENESGSSQTLQIVEGSAGTEFRVDGRTLFTIKSEQAQTGSIGVIALGQGRFGFTNFREGDTIKQQINNDSNAAPATGSQTDDRLQNANEGPPPLPEARAPTPPPPPPPPPVEQRKDYYIETNGKPEGPFSLSEVEGFLRIRRINGDSLIWKQGMASWSRVQDLAELKSSTNTPPPPPPPGPKIERFMLGTWQQKQMQGNIAITNTIKFFEDRSFAGSQTTQLAGGGTPSMTTPLSGQWKVEAVSDNRFTLTLSGRDGRPPVTTTQVITSDNSMRDDENGVLSVRLNQ